MTANNDQHCSINLTTYDSTYLYFRPHSTQVKV